MNKCIRNKYSQGFGILIKNNFDSSKTPGHPRYTCAYIPGGLTCWETCPDVYVEKLGKWFSFRPEMRELRDTQNECQIGQVPLREYNFCKTPSIRIQLRQITKTEKGKKGRLG